MIEFLAGVSIAVNVALVAWLWHRERILSFAIRHLMHELELDLTRCQKWKEHCESIAFQADGSSREGARYAADVTELRIEAEMKEQ